MAYPRVISRRLMRAALHCATVALCAVVAASCVVGPDYQRPRMSVPASFRSATQPTTQPDFSRDWWRLYHDPILTELEEAAARASPSIEAAVARVAQARASTLIEQAGFYPVVTFDPSIQRARAPSNGAIIGGTVIGGSSGPTTGPSRSGGTSSGGGTRTTVRIPFDVSYEIDIWGRVRRLLESARATAQASADDYEVVLQTLHADVAQNYFTLRSLDAQEEILGRTVASFQREFQLQQQSFQAGVASRLDVVQAEAQYQATRTQQIDVRRQRADAEHAIAVLIGRPPSELSLAPRPLDLEPPVVPPGLPAQLLRRRPDVAEAEQNLMAASAQVGVATANFYPTVSLTGIAGFQSTDVQHALDWEQRVWSIGPSINWPIFEGGRLRAELAQARARYTELRANYRNAVLTAFREVEDDLTDLHLRSDAAQAQAEAVRASTEYRQLSEDKYRAGAVNYLQVIDAERTLLNNELSAAQLLNQRLISSVLLIKALGGGWDAQSPPPVPQPLPQQPAQPTPWPFGG